MAKATSCRAGGDECLAIVLHPAVQFAQAFAAKQVVLRRRRAMALLFEDDSSGGALRFLDDESMCRCAAVCTVSEMLFSRRSEGTRRCPLSRSRCACNKLLRGVSMCPVAGLEARDQQGRRVGRHAAAGLVALSQRVGPERARLPPGQGGLPAHADGHALHFAR